MATKLGKFELPNRLIKERKPRQINTLSSLQTHLNLDMVTPLEMPFVECC